MGARAGLTTGRIVNAAADLADRIGFANVTISALARGFGVKDASLYSHIGSLNEVRTRVAALAAEEMSAHLARSVAGQWSPDERLAAFADAYRDYALRHPGRYTATQSGPDSDLPADSTGFTRSTEVTYEVVRAYGLREPDLVVDAARMMRSAFHGFIDIESTGGFGHPHDLNASWHQIVTSLQRQFTSWSRPASPPTTPAPRAGRGRGRAG
ncbi:transcriptional regulator [Kitasatospora phosalacinea]|uniref:Transcriptional regulator n=1 Tax=Kitasatospora phosalacinea TaxID=2065 RepID=A0A9W6QI69_9ACTN|nr:TetR-like C-terminal domain-containing protein [Kitasatospora phosalacinea]GLW75474.1 transcriptional regulator [Kitasatospora phosalacinea]